MKSVRKTTVYIPPLHSQQGLKYRNEKKTEIFADTMEQQFRMNDSPEHNREHETNIEEEVNRIKNTNDEKTHTPVKTEEIKRIIQKLPHSKSSGKFNITIRMVKEIGNKQITALTSIANVTLRLRHFPKMWKDARIVMLPKLGKDHKLPENYRPISLLPTLGKIVEKIILERIKAHSTCEKILPQAQFGFRENHNTELQLLRIIEKTREVLQQ